MLVVRYSSSLLIFWGALKLLSGLPPAGWGVAKEGIPSIDRDILDLLDALLNVWFSDHPMKVWAKHFLIISSTPFSSSLQKPNY